MKNVININPKNYFVNFLPKKNQVEEVKHWLFAEKVGFCRNWDNILSSFNNNRLVTISLIDETIGFVTWSLGTGGKLAKIEITEIKPAYRNMGVGKILITQLLSFFSENGFMVIYLECAPADSKDFWESYGLSFKGFSKEFIEHQSLFKDYRYKILIDVLYKSSERSTSETIELWSDEPYKSKSNDIPPSYIWNLEFKEETRQLKKPILHVANIDWRIRWKIKGETKFNDKIKRFKPNIGFETFIIISELPLI